MKNIFVLTFVVCLMFSFVGCDNTGSSAENDTSRVNSNPRIETSRPIIDDIDPLPIDDEDTNNDNTNNDNTNNDNTNNDDTTDNNDDANALRDILDNDGVRNNNFGNVMDLLQRR